MITSLLILGMTVAMSTGRVEVPAKPCLRALSVLTAGMTPRSEFFTPVECPRVRPAAAFRYDAAKGSSSVARSIAGSEIVTLFPEFGEDVVWPGQKLHILVSVGGVRVDRQVEAMQAARPGQKLFVRSADGQVLSARYEVRP